MKLSSIFLLAMGLVAPTAAIPIITSSSDLPANVTIAEAIELLSAQIDTSDIQSLETDASSRGSVANTVELGTDELLLWGQTSRGNVPDVTDLSVDIVSEEAAAAAVARITRQETDLEITDRLIFNTGISTFLYFKSKGQPTTLDWSDDGCSSSPDRPLGFNFLNSYVWEIPVGLSSC